ncbi:MAG: tyrosine-type recombinase/integrase [Candidatus Omnitrophica bacterium]|nr:tyrosine-type recombinase/integrase [Candidatus Omnitrophota bacterium]
MYGEATVLTPTKEEIGSGLSSEKRLWFNLEEASEYLGIHSDTLHKYVQFGLIKTTDGIRYPEGLRIEKKSIEELKLTPNWLKNFQKYTKKKPVPVQTDILLRKQSGIIREINDLYKNGEPLTPMYVMDHNSGLYQRTVRYFGTYLEAIKAAGIEPSKIYIKGNKGSRFKEQLKILNEKKESKQKILLLKIKKLFEDGQLDYKTRQKLNGVVSGYLGGWQNVYELLNIKVVRGKDRIEAKETKEDIIAEMGILTKRIDLRRERNEHRFMFTFKEDYEKFLRFDRQYAGCTIEKYLTDLTRFQKFVKKDLDKITEEDIRNFLLFLKEQKIKDIYLISCLRNFYKWLSYKLNNENIRTISYYLNNIIRIKLKREILSDPITSEDIDKLRSCLQFYKQSSCSSRFHKIIIRDIALFELLITTGMRQGELRKLRYNDVDLEKKIIIIRTSKTGLPRKSIFGETALNALKEYFVMNNFAPDDSIFLMNQGNCVHYIVKRWKERARIDKNLHAHLFRHYFITETLRRGVSVQNVAKQVGHSNLNSTFYYANTDIETIRKDLERSKI